MIIQVEYYWRWDFSISRRWTKVYRTHMIQQFAFVASDHMPIMSELADIIIEAPLGHYFPSGNIRLLAFFEHVLLIDLLVTLSSFRKMS